MFISSTFGGDTVALAASLATLRRIRAGGVIEHLWRQGARLMEGFNALAHEHEVPARMIGLAPRRVIAFDAAGGADANGLKGLLWQECLDRGVLMGNANFVSLAHDDAAVEATLDGVRRRARGGGDGGAARRGGRTPARTATCRGVPPRMTDPAEPEVAHGRRVFRNTLITGVVGVLSLLLNFFVVAYAIRKPRCRRVRGLGPGAVVLGVGGLPEHLRPRPAGGGGAVRR